MSRICPPGPATSTRPSKLVLCPRNSSPEFPPNVNEVLPNNFGSQVLDPPYDRVDVPLVRLWVEEDGLPRKDYNAVRLEADIRCVTQPRVVAGQRPAATVEQTPDFPEMALGLLRMSPSGAGGTEE